MNNWQNFVKDHWATIITAVVALYGAILSTLNHLAQRRDRKRYVTVKMSIGLLGTAPRSSIAILISAANPGSRAVTLQVPSIRLPDGNQLVVFSPQADVSFPHELPEGKSCTAWFDVFDVAQELAKNGVRGKVKLTGIIRDAVGGQYQSKPLRFDVDGWLKQKERQPARSAG